jgi:D-alanine-D-alanine ligase
VLSGDNKELAELDCDLAFIALHGEYGEDGQVQAELERLGIAYTGSGVESSVLSMNKHESKLRFQEVGVPVAPWTVVARGDDYQEAMRKAGLAFPVVVKPNSKGSSVGVSIVKKPEELAPAVECGLQSDDRAMIEKYLKGRELTVGVIEGKAQPVIELAAANEFYDYEAKYLIDTTNYLCPAPIEPALYSLAQDLAQRCYNALDMRDMGRIDFILSGDSLVVLEANSIPGFTSHSLLPKAARENGMSFEELCLRLAGLACNRMK